MNKDVLLYGISGLIIGGGIVWAIATTSVNNDYRMVMRMMGMNTARVQDKNAGHMGMSMNAMEMQLRDKTGDDFDRDFLDLMIAHHQGATSMVELAKQQAKHSEVKRMADNVASVQSKE